MENIWALKGFWPLLCLNFHDILLKSVGINGHCTYSHPIIQYGVVGVVQYACYLLIICYSQSNKSKNSHRRILFIGDGVVLTLCKRQSRAVAAGVVVTTSEVELDKGEKCSDFTAIVTEDPKTGVECKSKLFYYSSY